VCAHVMQIYILKSVVKRLIKGKCTLGNPSVIVENCVKVKHRF